MNEDKTDRYLFDPHAEVSDEVREIEEMLRPLRYGKPLRVARPRKFYALAAAAMIVMILGGVAVWLWTWPSERPWIVEAGSIDRMQVGQEVDADESLLVRVARIGWMRVSEGSVLTLLSTKSNHHRLAMSEGTLHVSIWAPPRSVAVQTPAGEVTDLGCEFIVRADAKTTSVDVVSGWVRLDNERGESLVPGGATSSMTAGALPTVPVFKSAPREFAEAVRSLERVWGDAAVDVAIRTARRRDVLTLLVMAERDARLRDRFVTRAAEMMPPRSAETVAAARRGNADAFEQWIGDLPLPPVTSWVPNWRDRLLR